MHPHDLWIRLRDIVLQTDATELSRWRRTALFAARLGVAVTVDFARGELTLRAMSLVYTTLLSLVPLLAVSFSVLKAFGVHSQLAPMLAGFLAPLGPQGQEIATRVVDFVENVQVGVLGTIGLVLLFYTVIALVQKVEEAFNHIWQVRHPRSFVQRFSQYISVLLVGPVLVFSALGITASVFGSETVKALSAVEPLGYLIDLAARLVPYLLIIAAFTFIYLFVPNTRVRPVSALTGAAVAGVLWQSTGWFFAAFVAGSAKYAAVYSAFATLIVFMLWLYLSWLILLIGCSVAHYYQYPSRLLLFEQSPHLSIRTFEHAGLCMMAVVAERHYARAGATTAEILAQRLSLPLEAVMPVLDALTGAGLLRALDDDDAPGHGYLPGTPLDETTTDEVLAALRRHGETRALRPEAIATPAAVRDLLQQRRLGAVPGPTLRTLAGLKGDSRATPAALPRAERN